MVSFGYSQGSNARKIKNCETWLSEGGTMDIIKVKKKKVSVWRRETVSIEENLNLIAFRNSHGDLHSFFAFFFSVASDKLHFLSNVDAVIVAFRLYLSHLMSSFFFQQKRACGLLQTSLEIPEMKWRNLQKKKKKGILASK